MELYGFAFIHSNSSQWYGNCFWFEKRPDRKRSCNRNLIEFETMLCKSFFCVWSKMKVYVNCAIFSNWKNFFRVAIFIGDRFDLDAVSAFRRRFSHKLDASQRDVECFGNIPASQDVALDASLAVNKQNLQSCAYTHCARIYRSITAWIETKEIGNRHKHEIKCEIDSLMNWSNVVAPLMELHNSVDWHSRWRDTKNDKFVNFEIENEKMKNALEWCSVGVAIYAAECWFDFSAFK